MITHKHIALIQTPPIFQIGQAQFSQQIPKVGTIHVFERFFNLPKNPHPNTYYYRHADIETGTDTLTPEGQVAAFNEGVSFWDSHVDTLLTTGLTLYYADNNTRTQQTAHYFSDGVLSVAPDCLSINMFPNPSLNDFDPGRFTETDFKAVMKKIRPFASSKGPLTDNLKEGLAHYKPDLTEDETLLLRVLLGDQNATLNQDEHALGPFSETVVLDVQKRLFNGRSDMSVSFTSRGNLAVIQGIQKEHFSTASWIDDGFTLPPLHSICL